MNINRMLSEERELARAQMADDLRNEIKKSQVFPWAEKWVLKLLDEVESRR